MNAKPDFQRTVETIRDMMLHSEIKAHVENARQWLRSCDKSLRRAESGRSDDPLLDSQEAEAAAHVAYALVHVAVTVANRMEPDAANKVKLELAGLNILVGAARNRSHEATLQNMRDIEIAKTATARA